MSVSDTASIRIQREIERLQRVIPRAGQPEQDERRAAQHVSDGLRRLHQTLRTTVDNIDLPQATFLQDLGLIFQRTVGLKYLPFDGFSELVDITTLLARTLAHKGGEWAVVMAPPLLNRLGDAEAISAKALYGLCALATHCYDNQGRFMGHVLDSLQDLTTASDPAIRRQLYALVKIAVEKWHTECFGPVVPALRKTLLEEMQSDEDERCSPAMHCLLILSQKYPSVGSDIFESLSKECQRRMMKDHPGLRRCFSPRNKLRKDVRSPSVVIPPPKLEDSGLGSSGSNSSSSSKPRRRRKSGGLGSHPYKDRGLTPTEANSSSTDNKQEEMMQKLAAYALKKNQDVVASVTQWAATGARIDTGTSPGPLLDKRQRERLERMGPTRRAALMAQVHVVKSTEVDKPAVHEQVAESSRTTGAPVMSGKLQDEPTPSAPTVPGLFDQEDIENSGNIVGNLKGSPVKLFGSSSKKVSFGSNDTVIETLGEARAYYDSPVMSPPSAPPAAASTPSGDDDPVGDLLADLEMTEEMQQVISEIMREAAGEELGRSGVDEEVEEEMDVPIGQCLESPPEGQMADETTSLPVLRAHAADVFTQSKTKKNLLSDILEEDEEEEDENNACQVEVSSSSEPQLDHEEDKAPLRAVTNEDSLSRSLAAGHESASSASELVVMHYKLVPEEDAPALADSTRAVYHWWRLLLLLFSVVGLIVTLHSLHNIRDGFSAGTMSNQEAQEQAFPVPLKVGSPRRNLFSHDLVAGIGLVIVYVVLV